MIDTPGAHVSAGAVAAALLEARRVSAFCHQNPDADTLGAAIAVAMIAERLGKEAEIVSGDPPAAHLSFLPWFDRVRPAPGLVPDVAVVLDAATLARTGSVAAECAAWFSAARIVNIDHHASNSRFGEVNLVDSSAAATCEMLTELLPLLGIEPDAELATVLLAGIVRDSRGFSDPSTTARTLRASALLVEAGAPLADVSRAIHGELPVPTLALWGRMLARVEERLGGRLVHTTLTRTMLEETGCGQGDADGLVEWLARSHGGDATIVLRELDGTSTRVSIRTTEAVDALALALPFGGGGHARRSGFIVEEPLERVRGLLLAEVERQIGG